MTNDPFAQFKAAQREGWSLFAPLEAATTRPAATLVRFAGVQPGEAVLDVACGTGVVAVTAARTGAKVRCLDLTPALLERARENAAIAGVSIDLTEGDAEALPYPDASFDVVLSQFGHMFAPRPEVVVAEMLRVLKPGGRIAFSTWPPELFIGRTFAMVGRLMPPPEGVAPPPQWGDPNVVRARLGEAVTDLRFGRDVMLIPTLSPQHWRQFMEETAGPMVKLVQSLQGEPAKLAEFRGEMEALISEYLADNTVTQHYLMSRATKR
jgi:SAM-dependent methyltransferase